MRFNFFHDRDFLILNSPHQFGDIRISFTEHNKGWNNRRLEMNYEVWLMLLGHNVDYWSQAHVEKVLDDCGHVIAWEEDQNHLSRILVKARVVDLAEIPWFAVYSEGLDFNGESWSVQIEILSSKMLGAGPQEEDNPPDDDNFNPNEFQFFGFGQPGQGPPNNPPVNPQVGPNVEGWGLWPENQKADAGNQNAGADNQQRENLAHNPDGAFMELNNENNGNADNNLVDWLDFDLNLPAVDDLGVIDDAIPDNDVPMPDAQAEPVQVINMESDESEGMPVIPDLNEQVHVEVFIPQIEEAPMDIPVEALVGEPPFDIDHLEDPNNQHPIVNQEMHLGRVEVFQPPVDLSMGFVSSSSEYCSNKILFNEGPQPQYFVPGLTSTAVEVPDIWGPFFMGMLMNPANFEWAKKFLNSKAIQMFNNSLHSKIHISIPSSCPAPSVSSCMVKNISLDHYDDLVEHLDMDPNCIDTAPEKIGTETEDLNLKEHTTDLPHSGTWSSSVMDQAGKLILSDNNPDLRRSLRVKEKIRVS